MKNIEEKNFNGRRRNQAVKKQKKKLSVGRKEELKKRDRGLCEKEEYLKEHLGENKTLNISKWKAEIGTLRKEKDTLYSQMIDIRKKVEQAESVRSCIDKLLQEKRGLTQVKKQELGL